MNRNQYYLNGVKTSESKAHAFFEQHTPGRYELNCPQLADCWESCQISEEVRDSYLPDGLEIIQA